jgi:hypothetical protein
LPYTNIYRIAGDAVDIPRVFQNSPVAVLPAVNPQKHVIPGRPPKWRQHIRLPRLGCISTVDRVRHFGTPEQKQAGSTRIKPRGQGDGNCGKKPEEERIFSNKL